MSDSDMDDSFLLEALEKVEQRQISSTSSYSQNCEKNEDRSSSSHGAVSKISPNPVSSNSEKENGNFRANLLKSLISCRASATNSKCDTSDNQSIISTKRKLDENNVESFSEEPDHPFFSPNKDRDLNISSTLNIVKKHNVCNNNQVLEPMKNSRESLIFKFDSPINSVVKKRKFPGPAGILPEWGQRGVKLNSASSDISKYDDNPMEKSICSQGTAQDFVSGPWKEMHMDLSNVSNSINSLQTHNIRTILRKNALRSQTCIRKVAFLVIMVRNIDLSHQDATAVFYDETGEIQGTVSENVLEKYGSFISSGAVLVLKDATILSPALFQQGMGILGQSKKHYLTITLNSIVTIYFPHDDGYVKKVEVVPLTKEGLQSWLSADEGLRERMELIESEENDDQFALYDTIGQAKNANFQVQNQSYIPGYKNPVYNLKNLSNANHGANFSKTVTNTVALGSNFSKHIPRDPKPGSNISKNIPDVKSGICYSKKLSNITKPGAILSKDLSSNSDLYTNESVHNPKNIYDIPAQYTGNNIPTTTKPNSNLKSNSNISNLNSSLRRPQLDVLNKTDLSFNIFSKSAREEKWKNTSIKAAAEAFGSFSDDEEFDSLLENINAGVL